MRALEKVQETARTLTAQKMNILVVDDDAIQRMVLSRRLSGHGHNVVVVADGAEAWEAVQRQTFNMVLTDWMMPKISGLELTRRIRSMPSDHYVYIIVCTAKSSRADLIEAMQVGADDFLAKPVDTDELWVRMAAGERVINLEKRLAEDKRELVEANDRLFQAYQTIQEDLRAAAKMQQSLLPAPATIQRLRFQSLFLPASAVAGDIFNYFALDESSVGFYALDVSGHGIPAAMLSVTLSKMLSTRPIRTSPLVEPSSAGDGYQIRPPHEAIGELNRRFQDQGDMYFTMAYGVIDQRNGILKLTQAGHPNPILLRASNPPIAMGEGGFPVGVLPEMTYEELNHEIKEGDRLFLSSDGILECSNHHGEQFGIERLMEFLEQHRTCALDTMMHSLEETMRGWSSSHEFADDVSLLAMELC